MVVEHHRSWTFYGHLTQKFGTLLSRNVKSCHGHWINLISQIDKSVTCVRGLVNMQERIYFPFFFISCNTIVMNMIALKALTSLYRIFTSQSVSFSIVIVHTCPIEPGSALQGLLSNFRLFQSFPCYNEEIRRLLHPLYFWKFHLDPQSSSQDRSSCLGLCSPWSD